jgi:hypothetical protein
MTVAIRRIIVPRHHRKISQGQAVHIMAQFVDTGVIESLLDPSGVARLSLYNPAGTAIVTEAAMTNVSTGVRGYTYQTLPTDAAGAYAVSISVEHASYFARVDKAIAFVITRTSFFSTVTYLAMRDQNSVTWYYYVLPDKTLEISSTVPTFMGHLVSAAIATVPFWIQIGSMYIYPLTDGTLDVTGSQPTGTGVVGSPTLTDIEQDTYVLALAPDNTILIEET